MNGKFIVVDLEGQDVFLHDCGSSERIVAVTKLTEEPWWRLRMEAGHVVDERVPWPASAVIGALPRE
jgi:hypothetical protein